MAALEVVGEVFVEPDREALVLASSDWILARIRSVLENQERCSLALSGGNTPAPVYRQLAQAGAAGEYDGSRLDLLLADERCVPLEHPDSNAGLVRQHWLAVDARPTLLWPRAESEDWGAEAERYASALPSPIDLVVLGIGPDGHTASLFPGSDAASELERTVLHISDSPKPPPHRWTLSPRALQDARVLITLVCGADKAPALARALEGPWDPSATPAQWARRGAWFVDAPVASLLSHETHTP